MSSAQFQLFGTAIPIEIVVSRFELREHLSLPFQCEVEFSTLDGSFDLPSILKESVALSIVGASNDTRIVHGMVSEARFLRIVGARLHFMLVLRPTLWELSQREDCRIFRDKTVVALITDVFEECGLGSSVHWDLVGDYPSREYVVQYQESTLNFIQRQLEDAGLFYFFSHSKEGHKLHITDNFTELNAQSPAFLSNSAGVTSGASPFEQCSRVKKLRVTEVTLRDFDFKNPVSFPEARIPTEKPTPQVLFDYPGQFSDAQGANTRSTVRLKQERFDADLLELTCQRADLSASSLLTIEGVEEEELANDYIIADLTCSGLQHHNDKGEVTHHTCISQIRAVPKSAVYLPPPRARRPKIVGTQTAVVVGEANSDQSITVDSFGRIKIHFHWDRRQPYDGNASCGVRVNQLPLGGSMIIPRVGWEVLVAFEEGDPDRPLVLGRTYNAENMPPMALPAAKASGSLSSMSSPGGAGKNEISIGDSGGGQGFGIKAQKDLNLTTGYDQTEEIAVDDEHQVNANLSRSVKVDDSITVSGNQDETYGAHLNNKVTGAQTINVSGNATNNATANMLESVTSDRKMVVTGNHMGMNNGERFSITGQTSRTVNVADIAITAASLSHNIGTTYSSQVKGVRVHLVKGGHSEVVKAAKTETIQAGAVHLTKADYSSTSAGAVAHVIGAVAQRKVTGDLTIKAPVITLVGAKGTFKGGSSELSLAGGPITLKGGTIVIKAALIKITAGSLKLG